jgi:UDP-glucose 4-epimerase
LKILITGGAGFVGSHLTEALLERGESVLVIDNYLTGRPQNLKAHPNLKVVEGTIADAGLVERLFTEFQPDRVIHAAAAYKDPENWVEDVASNVTGSANIAQAAQRHGVGRLIYFQTALCYGMHPKEQPITLNHPIQPEGSSYAISKTAGEQYIELSGIDYVTFRLANIIGPRNLSGPVATFYHRLTNDKPCFVMETRRDFVFVKDLVEVVLLALEGKGRRGAYHVSSGKDYSIQEVFDATVKALGITLKQEVEVRPRNPDDVFSILLDPSKTNADFGWEVHTPLEQAIAEAVAWYREHGIAQAYTHLKAVNPDSDKK